MLNVLKSLALRRIIKNIVLMSAAEWQPIKESWKSITKRKPLKMVLPENARAVQDF
jgi:hypothetical protein